MTEAHFHTSELDRPTRTRSRDDLVILTALSAATVAVRVLTLRTIDLGGDAAFKWFFVKSQAYANPWVFDHHTARFAIILPIWIVQRIFGAHPNGMYVLPLLAAVAQVPLLWACARLLGSVWCGVMACLALLLFEPAADSASQLLPGIFQATYVLGALHSTLRFGLDPQPQRRWLVLAAAWLFAAYLSMVTTVYFFPGAALAIWLVRGRIGDVAVVFGILAAAFVLETIGYALFSPYPFGQFQLILHTHTDVKPIGFWGLFGRFAALPLDWRAMLATWLACGAAWFGLRRRSELRGYARAYALWLLPLSGLAGMTLGIKSLNPIIPATTFDARYCHVLIPLLALGIGATLVAVASPPYARSIATRQPSPALPLAAAAIAIALTSWAAIRLYRPERSAFRVTDEQWSILNAAFETGIPIVGSNRSDHSQRKTLTCIEWAFLRSEQLLSGGQLVVRKLGKTHVGSRTHRYVSRDPLPPDVVARAIKRHRCLVTVERRDAEPKLGLAVYSGPECAPAWTAYASQLR
jgi:hypothetical protein